MKDFLLDQQADLITELQNLTDLQQKCIGDRDKMIETLKKFSENCEEIIKLQETMINNFKQFEKLRIANTQN